MPLPFLIAGLGAAFCTGAAATTTAVAIGATTAVTAAATTAAAVGTTVAAVGATAAAVGTTAAAAVGTTAAAVGTTAAAVGTTAAAAVGTTATAIGTTAAAATTAATTAVTTTAAAATTVASTAAATTGAAIGSAASTAVGSVATTATTIGSAASSAGSAIGSVAANTMGAIGTSVGNTSGAIAAATKSVPAVSKTAGSVAKIAKATDPLAVGVIATSGAVGTVNTASGAKKLAEASEIKKAAMSRYNRARSSFNSVEKTANDSMEKLGESKVRAWDGVDDFVVLWSRIHNKPNKNGDVSQESLYLTQDELDEFRYMALSVKDVIKNGVISVAGGALVGFAAQAGIATLATTASTGTAISTLSGAAGANVSLAALGGGSIASGGLGMAGGSAVMSGLYVAPAFAISGMMLNHQGSKALEAAEDIEAEVAVAVGHLEESKNLLKELKGISDGLHSELTVIYAYYREILKEATLLVDQNDNFKTYSEEERKSLQHLTLIVKLMKKVCLETLLDGKKVRTTEVRTTILESQTERSKFDL